MFMLSDDARLIKKFCETHQNIYVFGAGYKGEQLYKLLLNEGIHIVSFIVTQLSDKNNHLKGIDIQEVSNVKWRENAGVIVASDEDYWKEIDSTLHNCGIYGENVFFCHIWKSRKSLDKFYDFSFLLKCREGASTYFDQKNLKEIGKKSGTDKYDSNFLSKYEFFIQRYRYEEINVLELGVYHGASLKMWKEYFFNARIYGVDINENCKKIQDDRIKVIVGDLGDQKILKDLVDISPRIIVDDASHIWSHQIMALVNLFPALQHGGIYIVEDIHTSFRATQNYSMFNDTDISMYDFLSSLSEIVTSNEHLDLSHKSYYLGMLVDELEKIAIDVDMISFIRNSCIIVKK